MTDNQHLQRLNTLFDRLKLSPTDTIAKTKFKHIQLMLNNLTEQANKISEDKRLKIEFLTQKLKKIENAISEDIYKREQKEQALSSKINKVQKSCLRLLDNFTKQRSEMDKKLQISIDMCLSDINNYKSRTQNECTSSIKQIQSFLPQIDELIKEVENQAMLTKQILKKIYNQFIQQIQELRLMIAEQKSERESQQEQVIGRLEEVYHSTHKRICVLKANRQKSEKMLVDLLQKVIQKVKREIVGY